MNSGQNHLTEVILERMLSNFFIMQGLLMATANLRPFRQYQAAVSPNFKCSFSTPMLQLITIFMYMPQYFFSSILFLYSSPSLSFCESTSFSIISTILRALAISSIAFSCFFISLRIAALLRQVWIISYFYPFSLLLKRYSSIWMANETARIAKPNFFFFLQMQAKLLNVRTLILPSSKLSSTYLAICGVMRRSTALVISFKSMFSFSSLKFYIVTLLILSTKLLISCDKLNGTAFISFFYRQIIARCNNFSSLSKHSTVISSSLSL